MLFATTPGSKVGVVAPEIVVYPEEELVVLCCHWYEIVPFAEAGVVIVKLAGSSPEHIVWFEPIVDAVTELTKTVKVLLKAEQAMEFNTFVVTRL